MLFFMILNNKELQSIYTYQRLCSLIKKSFKSRGRVEGYFTVVFFKFINFII